MSTLTIPALTMQASTMPVWLFCVCAWVLLWAVLLAAKTMERQVGAAAPLTLLDSGFDSGAGEP